MEGQVCEEPRTRTYMHAQHWPFALDLRGGICPSSQLWPHSRERKGEARERKILARAPTCLPLGDTATILSRVIWGGMEGQVNGKPRTRIYMPTQLHPALQLEGDTLRVRTIRYKPSLVPRPFRGEMEGQGSDNTHTHTHTRIYMPTQDVVIVYIFP